MENAFNSLYNHSFYRCFKKIKKSIESGDIKEENGNVIWTDSNIRQIMRLDKLLKTFLLSFVEKGSHSFKESYGLKEFISHIQTQSIVLDVLLVQVKAIVSYYFNI